MAITGADVAYRLSGGAANADPNLSLGGAMSSTAVPAGPLNNLFDNVTGDENAASDVEYRCIYFRNGHGTLTWENVVAWLTGEVAGGASIAIGVGTAAAGAAEQSVVNENTAPSGVSFSSPTTKAGGVSLGNIPAGSYKALWIRRTAANTAALDNDGVTLNRAGDTAA